MKLEEIKNRTKEANRLSGAVARSRPQRGLTKYLGAMAKLHTYSFGNIMLIARQKPSASNVAGVRTWNSLGRFVRRGEKGILILAPMVGRKLKTIEGDHNGVGRGEKPASAAVRILGSPCSRFASVEARDWLGYAELTLLSNCLSLKGRRQPFAG